MKRRAILPHKCHPALPRARRKYARLGDRERAPYRGHRVRAESFRGEGKTWLRPARAIRRGLADARTQACFTAAVSFKRLAAVFLALLAAKFLVGVGRPCPGR